MYQTLAHFGLVAGFVALVLPPPTPHDAFHSLSDRVAPSAPPANVAAAPGDAIEQRAQTRIVDRVPTLARQVPPCVRVVPDLTAGTQNAAKDELARMNLYLGRVQSREVNRPRGTVVDQEPRAGTRVACGSPVDISVAVPASRVDDVRPQQPCVVPGVAGGELDDVRRQLARAGLEVGKVNTRESDRVRGTVISQSPASGTRVKCGSPVDLVVAVPVSSRGDDVQPEPCTVPNLAGSELAEVRRSIARAKLEAGKVTTRESVRARGTVIDQSPEPGSRVKCGAPIDVVIAVPVQQRGDDGRSDPPCVVPNLTGGGADNTRRQLAGAKLSLGAVNSRQSPRPVDTVLDQSPRAGTTVKCGSQVDVWIASAPETSQPPVIECRVPDVAGQEVRDIRGSLAEQKLRLGNVIDRPSDRRAGTVVDQDPRPGTAVKCGSQVDVFVATPPPCQPVPRVVGRDPKTAAAVLERAGLRLGTVSTRESDRTAGFILEQSPPAGSDVTCGTPVAVWVAAAPVLVRVPPLVGSGATEARRTLDGAGLSMGEVARRESEERTGTVVDQLPPPGTLVKPGTAVQVWLATPQTRTVPDLRGRDQRGASEALTTARLRLGETGERPSDDRAGTVVDQSPKAGTAVAPSTPVHVWFATPRSAAVPDLRGRDRNGAIEALTNAGLRVGDIGERPSDERAGTVIDQMPPAGTLARLNTPVQVWLAVPVPIEVPSVIGRREADAAALLRDRRLRIGSVRIRESAEPRGVVIEQTPQAGQRVGAQTAVDLWLATPRRIQVPDFRGRNRADAIDAIRRAGLTVGPALERDGPEPQGTVADQQPAAGVEVDADSAVSLWIATPARPVLVEVPDVGGRTRAEAERILAGRGLTPGGAVTTESSTIPPGSVVRQQPAAGTRVVPGTVVEIVTAIAASPAAVRVPGVAGLPLAEARELLRSVGLQPGAINEVRAWAAAGTVTSQRPEAGSTAPAGAAVDLAVAASSAAFLWVFAGMVLGLTTAAGVSRIRARRHLPPSLTLAPYADAGIQVSVPDDGALADCEISLQGFRDDGVQALQGPLVIGEIAEAR